MEASPKWLLSPTNVTQISMTALLSGLTQVPSCVFPTPDLQSTTASRISGSFKGEWYLEMRVFLNPLLWALNGSFQSGQLPPVSWTFSSIFYLIISSPFPYSLFLFVFVFLNLFIYLLFLAVLGLRFCARASSSCGEWGPLFIAVRGPLTVVASLVAEHRLQTRRLSSCGSWV